MRESVTNSAISAWEELCGPLDINATPIAPVGTKVMVHDTPETRGSWQAHGQVGFYVGRALNHYRCYTVWMSATRAKRISDCLSWHPIKLHMPGSSPIEELTAAITDIERALIRIADIPALAHSRQPITDAASTIANQIRGIADLFRPPPISITKLEPPPGFTLADKGPPRSLVPSNTVQSVVAQINPVLQPTPATQSPATMQQQTAPLQRVYAAAPIPTTTASTAANSQMIIPVQPNQVVTMPRKARSRHSYLVLSPAEIHRVTRVTVDCIGMQFSDDSDPTDSVVGTVTNILRHRKTRKLVFQYWDHAVHGSAPTRPADFDYIDTKYAVAACKWKPAPRQSAHSAAIAFPQHGDHDSYAFTAQDTNADGTRLTSSSALKGPEAARWLFEHGEEIVKLIESTTARLIVPQDMPRDRKAAYYNPQCKIKDKPTGVQYRVRGTIGGNQIHYPGATAAYTASLETIRILLNTVVSEKANFCTADIKDFYLGTPLERPEYMRISLKHIPAEIQLRYNMAAFAHNGYVLMEVNRSIYGLPQAGKLSQDRLVAHLTSHGYKQCTQTPCLFIHESNGIAFTLVVDDFLIKYQTQTSIDHLTAALRELYVITTNFNTTQKYVGITLTHNRAAGTIDMSMPGYVQKALLRFKRSSLRGANSPIIYVPPRYGRFQQEVHPEAPSTPLTAAEILEIQEIVGVFLFYARAVDPTMYTAINKIGSKQAKPTSLLKQEVERFLQYASKWPNATMRIRASNMKLVCHSDGSYLSESEARSRAGGILFLGDCADDAAPNAALTFISVIIPTVVASATETEYASAFLVGQAATSIVHTLTELGYPQSEPEIFCDNLCAVGIANNTLQIKRSKTIDMRYHWLRDQVNQKKFRVTWKAGKLNLADFFTKAHPVHHHLAIRWKYVVHDATDTTHR